MSIIDAELLSEFLVESRRLVEECETLLEEIEGDASHAARLEEYANKIDRVMGAAKSLGMLAPSDHALHMIGDATALCKALGYRGATTAEQPHLYDVTVSFLLDSTESVKDLLERINEPADELRREMKTTLVERMRWISDVYRQQGASAAASDNMGQDEIDQLMKKLGD